MLFGIADSRGIEVGTRKMRKNENKEKEKFKTSEWNKVDPRVGRAFVKSFQIELEKKEENMKKKEWNNCEKHRWLENRLNREQVKCDTTLGSPLGLWDRDFNWHKARNRKAPTFCQFVRDLDDNRAQYL
ncbi:hypothetical protein M0802_004263 [Mischocyttarus mexicanus]|nr:hypothetical protein M0802_004263 [Mischocyttarus mexicanus]